MRKFWEILKLNHRKLTLFNIIYFLLTLPLLFCLYVLVNTAFGVAAEGTVIDVLPGLGFYMSIFSGWSRLSILLLIVASGLLYGPVRCFIQAYLISFYNADHSFFADIWLHVNRKLGREVPLGVLDLLICGFALANLTGFLSWPGAVQWIIRFGSAIVLIFWMQVRRLIFMMVVCSDLKVWPILKNSIILSVSGLGDMGRSITVSIVIWGITYLTLPLITVIVLPIAAYWLNFLNMTCCLYPQMRRYVLREDKK